VLKGNNETLFYNNIWKENMIGVDEVFWLSVSLEKSKHGNDTIKMETTAGYRKVTAYGVTINDGAYVI
jgi:hypothetical protein